MSVTDSDIIIRTKLHRPPTDRDHLHRGALLDRLSLRRQSPLVLVSAPAGYGKSTLVSCWLKTCDVPHAWVSLDGNDSDLRLFLTYFVAAVQSIFPDACCDSRSMLKLAHLPPMAVLAKSLINELDRIETDFILVLDDFHLIRDKSAHRLMAGLLDHPSTTMQLVLIGRRDPPLPLTSLRARGQMVEIRTQDLRFSLAETEVFLKQMTGAPIDKAMAAILEEKTEGWVTGLRLAALSLRHRKDLKHQWSFLPAENRYVMDYVVTEVLSHYPPAIQECILKASVLSRFCAPLCAAVCISDTNSDECGIRGRELMELLVRANLFIIPLDEEHEWFRYHHLFQALLRRQLKKRLTEDEIGALYRKASAWFAENGYIEESLSHAFESGNMETVARLIEKYRPNLMNREQWYHLDRWLQKIPTDFIQKHTNLLLAKAWVLQRQARYTELFDILEKIEDPGTENKKPSSSGDVFLPEIQVLKGFQYYSTARAELAETSVREALHNLPNQQTSIRGFALIILALALQMRGDPEQARRLIYEAMRQEEASIPVYKTMLLAALCYVNWIAADLNNLKPAAAQLLQHGRTHDLPESVAVGNFFTGILHYQLNDLEMAERHLVSVVGTPAAGELAVPSIVTFCQSSFALALTYQAMDREEEAGRIIESVMGYMLETGNTDLLEICQAFQAELALCQGRFAEAFAWCRSTPKPLVPAYRFYVPHLVMPKVLLARQTAGSLNEAEAQLSRIYDFYTPIHNTRVIIDVLALQSLLYAAKGNQSQALEKLSAALALSEPGGFIRPFLDLGSEAADLMGRLLEQNPSLSHGRRILAAFGDEMTGTLGDGSDDRKRSTASLTDEALIDPLTNREIEVLKILAKGLSNQEIADSLYISPETVKRHLSTIYRKLDVKNRQQAVISARSIGIL